LPRPTHSLIAIDTPLKLYLPHRIARPDRTDFGERILPRLDFLRRRAKYSATENTFPLYLDGNPMPNATPFFLP
jgi:hypothetical protein